VTTERIDELTIIKRDTKACLFCFLRIVSPSSRSHRNCFSPDTRSFAKTNTVSTTRATSASYSIGLHVDYYYLRLSITVV